ncbi:MAG: 16S rRNA (cytidine(1402)-2'-O)-methyltransferase [Gammaproteobacteria bacterium HGW-Gammaproteobacteria-3]|nr:MAG: 16S rRNA (cytidine(1402)-2'-O)-methyltransferase [Gammaproteobacteria bacterium HGW-Gammaproteobacteria-3]
MSNSQGRLYVVATPIGNLADFSFRAVEILKTVDLIAAEDTRHVKMLLQHYGINGRLQALHQHNEDKASQGLIDKMLQGMIVALVSDAGTPLLSDPGLPLVQSAREAGIEVSPIPGACALIAALSVAGLPVSRFIFEGFLPRTSAQRKTFFKERLEWQATWVFYESSHRILATLQDMSEVFPAQRQLVVAREMTKLHETIVKSRLDDMLVRVLGDPYMSKGEFVVIVEGADDDKHSEALTEDQIKLLRILLTECSVKTAAALAAEITGVRKKTLYQAALAMSGETH